MSFNLPCCRYLLPRELTNIQVDKNYERRRHMRYEFNRILILSLLEAEQT